jgi:O-acetyl-ADP-ribose deacetylase (regulator of RNase III)
MNTIKYEEGDLFAAIAKLKKIIAIPHVCNNQGAWGAGFVVPLAKTFPLAKQRYYHMLKQHGLELGDVHYSHIPDTRIVVANMIAQTLGGERPLYYNMLAKCMDDISRMLESEGTRKNNIEIHAPAFGSGLAGGRWDIIAELIEDCWLRRNLSVTIHYLPGQDPRKR